MDGDFRQLFSSEHNCKPGEFEKRVFRMCLFPHALPFAGILRRINANFFREDLDLLRELATAKNTDEVICELNRFYGRNRRDKNRIRTDLFFRISGKRVLRLYREVARSVESADEDSSESGRQETARGSI